MRPSNLSEFIGQHDIVSNLSKVISRSKEENRQWIDHALFHGPAGLGKTSLAQIIASELGSTAVVTSGPSLGDTDSVVQIVRSMKAGQVLFIDEIHRLTRQAREMLYLVMEDSVADVMFGTGSAAMTIRLPLPRFTIVGATTRLSLLEDPFRARFGNVYHMEYYSEDNLTTILTNEAVQTRYTFSPEGIAVIAQRGRGTPRVALRLLRRCADYGNITPEVALSAMGALGIDHLGLNATDRKVLDIIIKRYNGGPVGLATIAATINEEEDTVADTIEPYLLHLGLMDRTRSGRTVSRAGYEHMGIEYTRGTL